MRRVRDNLMPAAGATWPLFRLPILLVALTAAGAAVAQQAQPNGTPDSKTGGTHTTYRVINLAAGRLASLPDINATGQVAFSMQAGAATRATGYFYDGTAVRNIGTLGGNEVLAIDLNDLGQVAGRDTRTFGGNQRAFVWSAGGGMVDIAASSPDVYLSGANAINNHGVVTGTFQSVFFHHAFRWTLGSGLEDLGALT
jgi:probable HAF family extracellular repeat protein